MSLREVLAVIRSWLNIRLFEVGGTPVTGASVFAFAVVILASFWISGFGVALQSIGISVATVFAAGAVAAVAIGFALQNILQNFARG
jgi:small-conductance mechanosensitive channel